MSADTVSAQVQTLGGVAKTGRAFGLPIVHSTVNVKTGLNKPPIPHLRKVIGDLPTVDRTTINSWEDVKFLQAVKATGRKKLIMTALWTEACLTFPALAAILIPAAFFLSVAFPTAKQPNGLINLAYVGALFLATAVLSLGVGLIRAARQMER